MPGTPVDAVPPTQREPEPQPTHPRGSSSRGCAIVAVLGLVLGGLAALAVYLLVFQARARAVRHIPSNVNLVARFDLVDLALFAPVRKHLAPLLSAAPPTAPSTSPPTPSRVARFREATGIDLGRDPREVVLASLDATSWVALVGGHLARGRFVSGMERLLRDEGVADWHREGELLVGPLGAVIVAQADDGTVIIGTDASLVAAALPATDDASQLRVPTDAAATFVVTAPAWSGLASELPHLPHGSVFGKIERATGRLTLGDAPAVSLRLDATSGDAPALMKELEAALDEARALHLLVPDVLGEKSALRSTRLTVVDGAVHADAPWPYDALDRACERLGSALARVLPASAAPLH